MSDTNTAACFCLALDSCLDSPSRTAKFGIEYCRWEDIEENVLYLVFFVVVVVVVVFFFFHSFIGYSSYNIQYKFIIQRTKKKKRKERKTQKG